VLPVVKRGGAATIVAASLSRSSLWQRIVRLRLRINMRVQQLQGADAAAQAAWSAYLLSIGEGRAGTFPGTDFVPVPEDMLAPTQDVRDLIAAVYGDVQQRHADVSYLVERAILTPRNVDVDNINRLVSDAFPGEVSSTAMFSKHRELHLMIT
jgi:hypothetical protein